MKAKSLGTFTGAAPVVTADGAVTLTYSNGDGCVDPSMIGSTAETVVIFICPAGRNNAVSFVWNLFFFFFYRNNLYLFSINRKDHSLLVCKRGLANANI